MEFLAVLGITIVIMAFVFLAMSVRILLKKKGQFPSLHISHSKPMQERGITCVQSQDKAEQNKAWQEENKLK
ncbi:MAG: hypothetical protein ACK5JS_06740 [Mangrovibacterium sp.]